MVEIVQLEDAPYAPSNKAKCETQNLMEKAHDNIIKNSRERTVQTKFAIDRFDGCGQILQEWFSLTYRERKEYNFDYQTWKAKKNKQEEA